MLPPPEYQAEPASELESSFRHSGWQPRRRLVWAALLALGAGKSRLDRFAQCGSHAVVVYSPTRDAYRIQCNHCHDRFCLPCAQARANCAAAAVAAHLATCPTPVRFVTLTLRHSQTPLADQIKRLYAAFANLRRSQLWRDRVNGGVAFLEIKYNPRSALWHPHLHMLVQTQWLPQKELAERWHAITGDSFIVDVRPIRDTGEVTSYCTKYATKPFDTAAFAVPAALLELMRALRHHRTMFTFGAWRGVSLTKWPAADEHPDDWHTIARLDELIPKAQRGNAWAAAIILAATRRRIEAVPAPP